MWVNEHQTLPQVSIPNTMTRIHCRVSSKTCAFHWISSCPTRKRLQTNWLRSIFASLFVTNPSPSTSPVCDSDPFGVGRTSGHDPTALLPRVDQRSSQTLHACMATYPHGFLANHSFDRRFIPNQLIVPCRHLEYGRSIWLQLEYGIFMNDSTVNIHSNRPHIPQHLFPPKDAGDEGSCIFTGCTSPLRQV